MSQLPKQAPDIKAFFTNMRAPLPWTTKVRVLFRNNWLKIRNWQNCCGHHGEPGC